LTNPKQAVWLLCMRIQKQMLCGKPRRFGCFEPIA
jgi:hypothetical protein